MTSWRFGPGAASSPCSYRLVDNAPSSKIFTQRTTFDLFIVSLTLVLSVPNPRRCPIRTDARAGQRLCLMHEPCLSINSIICARGLGFSFASMAGCFGYNGGSYVSKDRGFRSCWDHRTMRTFCSCLLIFFFFFLLFRFLLGFGCPAPVGIAPNLPHI
ncbi:hypothetical protein BO85DRAFT_215141 [Aspergillus piperis CBS 112811]|uniref:Uncharacterized protein n=1 Tax=Aspergillus piperis CBS 112811 TaxID=1448313 RepID=A0A8G1VGP0_9EURO|nr:hypothetical protein BO85DRAFT_215141 [Aspergillus piperis CBS 112811]RAH51815.1 hypothetical protein BO85DRAFT_215141 [Aspergillus piperis CBS 112811]